MRAGCALAAFQAAAVLAWPALAAAERAPMPPGALVCRDIEPVVEHARIVRNSAVAGLGDRIRAFTEPRVASGACRMIQAEVTVEVVDVDGRGYALVEEDGQGGRWWTDAENLWGYFDTPARIKAWKKP